MKRSELERKRSSVLRNVTETIERAPQRSVIASFFLGIVVACFPGVVIPLIAVAAAVYAAVWFVSEPGEETELDLPVEFEATETETSRVASPMSSTAGARSGGRSAPRKNGTASGSDVEVPKA
ncbi:MAG: hypothetical protein KDD44_07840 [Bdellovibrionales bacterium]|nr:hypothetical protein [Bdellovibrionales bacterium]